MGNRYPISTDYFCSNCEEEVQGFPVGERIPSGRPLCLRCTHIGMEEGWAASQDLQPDERIQAPQAKMGTFALLTLLFLSGVALFVAIVLCGPHGRR